MGLKHFFLILVVVDYLLVTRAERSAFRKSLKISASEDDDISDSVTNILKNQRMEDSTVDPSDYLRISTSDHQEQLEYSTPMRDYLNDIMKPLGDNLPTRHIDLEMPEGIDDDETNSTDIYSIEIIERVPHSKLFTTLLNLEEDYNMSFEQIAKIFAEDSSENNLEKKRRRKERKQETMDIYADLEDDLAESELVKQDVKYKSLGIEPLALVVLPEGRTRKTNKDTTTTTLPWSAQYDRTSYLLTSNSEIYRDPFLVKNKSAKQLELQGNDVANVSHEAAFLKNNPDNTVYLLPSLTVELAVDSNLLMTPNERQEIPFEVTNNLNSATRVTFTVRDELGILLEIDRYIAILRPHASTTVRVAVLPKSGQNSDRITFIATGSEQVRKDVLIDFGGNYQSDTDAPFVDYTYTSDCTDIVLSKCKEGTWTIKISAQDSDSGIKLLTTIPKGLYFPDAYTSGTREEVTGIYSESCCNADLQIIAVDRNNNRYSRQINAYRAPLSFWAVTAITSVSLIFLAIIIVSSLICLKKCKRNEADSFDLPTYRGGRSRY